MHLWQISIHRPFFFFVYVFSLVPLQRGQLQVLHSSSSYGVLTRPGQKMMTSAIFIVIFWSSYEAMAKDNNELTSSSFFFFLTLQKMTTILSTRCHLLLVFIELHKTTTSLSVPRHLVLVFLRLQKTTMNLLAHRHLLVFFSLCCNNIFGVIYLEFALRHLI